MLEACLFAGWWSLERTLDYEGTNSAIGSLCSGLQLTGLLGGVNKLKDIGPQASLWRVWFVSGPLSTVAISWMLWPVELCSTMYSHL